VTGFSRYTSSQLSLRGLGAEKIVSAVDGLIPRPTEGEKELMDTMAIHKRKILE
jgi:hypothetical protein